MSLFSKYLFTEFIGCFSHFFCFERANCLQRHAYYTWADAEFAEYMLSLLQCLTPINNIDAGEILFSELDDINEVVFVTHGKFGIGYEINKRERYPMEVQDNSMIGGFEVSFNRRSQYIYKAIQNIKGYFMTKTAWK